MTDKHTFPIILGCWLRPTHL